MNSRIFAVTLVLAVLALGGGALNRWVAPALPMPHRGGAALPAESLRAAGPGLVFALIGGFRALAADVAWLRMHQAWERRDWVTANTLLHLVCTLDPRPLYFWLNGARIMAHDFAAWRAAAAGGGRHDLRRDHARAALRFLAMAERFHPANPRVWIERAGIELHGAGDPAAAAESYRRAAELPGCPGFAGRLHVALLCRLGRSAEALEWLRRVLPAMPPGEDAALMRERIHELAASLAEEKAIQLPADR